MRRLVFCLRTHLVRSRLRFRPELPASSVPDPWPALAIYGKAGDGKALGRFDGVDCRLDTPCRSGFDSRAFQPRRPRRCAGAASVLS